MELTKEELKSLINIVGRTNVPVSRSPYFVDLINKMGKMVDEFEKGGEVNINDSNKEAK